VSRERRHGRDDEERYRNEPVKEDHQPRQRKEGRRANLENVAAAVVTERIEDRLGFPAQVKVDVGVDDLRFVGSCSSELSSFRVEDDAVTSSQTQSRLFVAEDLLEVLRGEEGRGGDDEGGRFDGVGGEEGAVPGDGKGVVREFGGKNWP
jgi:hypothetical protein